MGPQRSWVTPCPGRHGALLIEVPTAGTSVAVSGYVHSGGATMPKKLPPARRSPDAPLARGKPKILHDVERAESTSRANTPDVPASARDLPHPAPSRVVPPHDKSKRR